MVFLDVSDRIGRRVEFPQLRGAGLDAGEVWRVIKVKTVAARAEQRAPTRKYRGDY
jgi:hypothetical protein